MGLSYARHPIRVLGVDPGLTRCGVGVVEGAPGRPLTLVARRGVSATPADADIARPAARARARHRGLARRAPARRGRRRAGVQPAQRAHRDGHRPGRRGRDRAAPRGAGCRSRCTPRARSRPPSPAAAGPTRPRSTAMVTRLLRLDATRRSPADAADALALAICHIWRGGGAGPAAPRPPGRRRRREPRMIALVRGTVAARRAGRRRRRGRRGRPRACSARPAPWPTLRVGRAGAGWPPRWWSGRTR